MNALKKFAELFVELQRRAEYERKRRELGYEEKEDWQEQAFAGDDDGTAGSSHRRTAPVYFSTDDPLPELDDLALDDESEGPGATAYEPEAAPIEVDAYALRPKSTARHAVGPVRDSVKHALRSPESFLHAVILKELLDRPLAMRRSRGLFRYR
jgi:hypothetical protein